MITMFRIYNECAPPYLNDISSQTNMKMNPVITHDSFIARCRLELFKKSSVSMEFMKCRSKRSHLNKFISHKNVSVEIANPPS